MRPIRHSSWTAEDFKIRVDALSFYAGLSLRDIAHGFSITPAYVRQLSDGMHPITIRVEECARRTLKKTAKEIDLDQVHSPEEAEVLKTVKTYLRSLA